MDQQLKARLIGATILVILAVVLIPELLSGRKAGTNAPAEAPAANGMRTYTIDLTARTGTGSTQTPSAEPPAATQPAPGPSPAAESAPVPAQSTPPPETPKVATAPAGSAPRASAPVASSPAPAAHAQKAAAAPSSAAPSTTPKPVTESRAPSAPASGEWSVQVGAFGSAATSRKLVGDLKAAGYTAYVSPITKGGKTLHRVRVGPVASRADADRLATRLKSRGLPVSVVGND